MTRTSLVLALCTTIAWPSLGRSETSANVALTTDYVWRGVSQTLEDPAVQGGFDFDHDSGVYAGVWASNVDFFEVRGPDDDPADDDEANIEIDLYLGIAGEMAIGITWDVGAITYQFPGADDDLLDHSEEIYVGVGYAMLSAFLWQDFENQTTYLEAGANIELPMEFSLGLHLGHWYLDESEDYLDYKLSLSRDLAGFDLEVAYTDTDMNDSECEDFSGVDDLCGGRAIFTVSREF